MRIPLLILALLSASLTTLQSKTIYLAKNGDDANSGTLQEPYGSVAKAASQLFAGDTLFGATYCVFSPEHPLVAAITTDEQREAGGSDSKQGNGSACGLAHPIRR